MINKRRRETGFSPSFAGNSLPVPGSDGQGIAIVREQDILINFIEPFRK